MKRIFWKAALALALGVTVSVPAFAQWKMQSLPVPGTDGTLEVWTLEGTEPGSSVLIIGGIHGDEPGGYLSADWLVGRIGLTRGRIEVIPRSNLVSILRGMRGAEGDLNRQFGRGEEGHPINRLLEQRIAKADAILNLHDGRGFYRETYEDDRHNPRRYGQSIVADAETWITENGESIPLGGMARRVIDRVNPHIRNEEWKFRFLDTNTADASSRYRDLVHSATFFALQQHGIPGFGIETSRDLPNHKTRVRHQVLVIKAFLEEFGLLEDPVPDLSLDEPQLDYVLVKPGDEPAVALGPGETLEIEAHTPVQVTDLIANSKSGWVVDVDLLPGIHDLGKSFVLEDRVATVKVLRDGDLLALAKLQPVAPAASEPPGSEQVPPLAVASLPSRSRGDEPGLRFRARIGGQVYSLGEDEVLEIAPGHILELLDPDGVYDARKLLLDLVGFAGGNADSPREDRGIPIDPWADLLPRYSLLGAGEYYRVRAHEGDLDRGGFFLHLSQAPRLLAVNLRQDASGPIRVAAGSKLAVPLGSVLTIQDVETSLSPGEPVVVNFKGYAGPNGPEDRGLPVRTDRDLLRKWALDPDGRQYEIQVHHRDRLLGRVVVELTD